MSNEGDKAAVFRSTKVRTKLRGDGSWLQSRDEPQAEAQEEKPWLAELKARRLNEAAAETSPENSTSAPEASNTQRSPTKGYLIRGVFTKLENSVSPPSLNGTSKTSQFTKRPSDSYKKIAPQNLRNSSGPLEDQLSPEEQEKRTEAARNVLKSTAAKQRSYVFSAAKKYEAKETPPDPSLVSISPSFVAKRIEIFDDDSSETSSSAPEPQQPKLVDSTVNAGADSALTKSADPKVDVPSEAVQDVPLKDETSVSSEVVVAVKEASDEPRDPAVSLQSGTPLVKLVPASGTSSKESSASTEAADPAVPEAEGAHEPEARLELPGEAQVQDKSKSEPVSTPSPDLSPEEGTAEVAREEEPPASSPAPQDSVENGPGPTLSSGKPITDDLLGFSHGPEESTEPVPPSPKNWSHSHPVPDGDVTETPEAPSSPSAPQQEEATQAAEETQSQEDAADPQSSDVKTVTESSSADPFDPYPKGSTSHNSASDPLQPLVDVSINSSSTQAEEKESSSPDVNARSDSVESLADDLIPNMDTTRSHQSWTRDTSESPQEAATEKSQQAADTEPVEGVEDEQTIIKFERNTTENDSPWDRWTLPTVYTITDNGDEESEEGEEEDNREEEEEKKQEEEENEEEKENQREAAKTPEESPALPSAPVEEEKPAENLIKHPVVYLKYINEVDQEDLREVTKFPMSSTCTYCGKQVGNEGKITIEHLDINCHPECFKCEVCSKSMGDLLDSMFLHGGKVHCEDCYRAVV